MRSLTSKKVNLIVLLLLVGFALLTTTTAQTVYGDTIKLPNNGGTITGKLVATSGPSHCYRVGGNHIWHHVHFL